MARCRVLVTDANQLAGLGAVRSLGRAGHHVVAAWPDGIRRPPSSWSRFCGEAVISPDPCGEHAEYRDWLRKAVVAGTYDAVFPVTEAALAAADAVRAEYSKAVAWVMPSSESLDVVLSKARTLEAAVVAGVPCPTTVFLGDDDDKGIEATLDGLGTPFVIKTDNILDVRGRYVKGRTYRLKSVDEARSVLRCIERCGRRAVAQRYVRGHGEGAFHLRWQGETILHFAHRRLHEVPYIGGWSSLRESVIDRELQDYAERLLKAIDFEGVAMVEFRREAATGIPLLMEINGRLWGSLALALHAGVDFPNALLSCHLHGRPPSAGRGIPQGSSLLQHLPG